MLLMLPLHSLIPDEGKKTHQSGSSDGVSFYVLYTLHNMFIDVLEPLI